MVAAFFFCGEFATEAHTFILSAVDFGHVAISAEYADDFSGVVTQRHLVSFHPSCFSRGKKEGLLDTELRLPRRDNFKIIGTIGLGLRGRIEIEIGVSHQIGWIGDAKIFCEFSIAT